MNGRRQIEAGQVNSKAGDEAADADSQIDLGIAVSVYGKTPEGQFVIIQEKPAKAKRAARKPGEPTQH